MTHSATQQWVMIPDAVVDPVTGKVTSDVPKEILNSPNYDGQLTVLLITITNDPSSTNTTNSSLSRRPVPSTKPSYTAPGRGVAFVATTPVPVVINVGVVTAKDSVTITAKATTKLTVSVCIFVYMYDDMNVYADTPSRSLTLSLSLSLSLSGGGECLPETCYHEFFSHISSEIFHHRVHAYLV